jgi:CRISPR/Cas system-associated endoribonuclease Cas2
MMKKYKTLIIYSVSDAEQKQALENELEKYGLERVGTQNIFVLPLEEYRTKVQAFKAYLRAYVRKHLDSQDTVLFVESRMNEEQTLTAMLQTNLMSEEE